MYILTPILLIRIYSHFKYRGALPGEFLQQYKMCNFIFYAGYGFWDIFNICRYFNMNAACRKIDSMSMNNFIVSIILGTGPAGYCILVTLFCFLFIPVLFYQIYKQHRARTEFQRNLAAIKKNLISRNYEKSIFSKVFECSICLDEFSEVCENERK